MSLSGQLSVGAVIGALVGYGIFVLVNGGFDFSSYACAGDSSCFAQGAWYVGVGGFVGGAVGTIYHFLKGD